MQSTYSNISITTWGYFAVNMIERSPTAYRRQCVGFYGSLRNIGAISRYPSGMHSASEHLIAQLI